jgi:hypothetical protein
MRTDKLVFGILGTARECANPAVALKLRSFTVAWSRYGYYDLIIENDTINKILDEAVARRYSYCLVQAYGHLINEAWVPKHWDRGDFHGSIRDWISEKDFFVTGHILRDKEGGYGLGEDCLLVNLAYYEEFGKPEFGSRQPRPVELVKPDLIEGNNFHSPTIVLQPSNERVTLQPHLPGWNFINVSLENARPVYSFTPAVESHKLYFDPKSQPQGPEFMLRLNEFDLAYEKNRSGQQSEDRHKAFLDSMSTNINNVKRGVFLWNLEPYEDVKEPPPGFEAPLTSLYSVAAGFKPNMILHTHGFDENTRVVFFDYSLRALEIKKLLHEEWDGEDYPDFTKYIFKKFPHPETYYHLWAGLTPEKLDWNDVNRFWEEELGKWGGAQILKEHWASYKKVRPSYVHCNILTEQQKLLAHIDGRPNSVIWWSNAFFTMYSNWYYTFEERKQIYDDWINGLSKKNPDIFLYGSDYSNISVNFVRAEEYAEQYSHAGSDYLNPFKLHRCEIRF